MSSYPFFYFETCYKKCIVLKRGELLDRQYLYNALFSAYYGGILGLFTGFSFVSGIEFIYFVTVRLIPSNPKKTEVQKNTKMAPSVQNVKPLAFGTLNPTCLKLYEEQLRKDKRFATIEYVN